MDKRLKWIIYAFCGLIVAFAAVWAVLRFGFGTDLFARKGWDEDRYLDGLGKPLYGWQTVDDIRYYFNPVTGRKSTGWIEVDSNRYCLDENGHLRTGWFTDESGTYLLRPDGSACTGWIETDRGERYFDECGVMAVGILRTEEGLYHFSPEGAPVSGWQAYEEQNYCFDEDGRALTGWQEMPEGICYFDADGVAANGWKDLEGKRYYFENGLMQTGWLILGSDRYYLLEDGTMAVGEVVIDGVSRFFTSKGKYVVLVNAWHAVPEDYTMELVDVRGFEFDITGAQALEEMLDACWEAGYECYINNTYRSVYTQERLYYRRLREYTQERGMSYYEADYIIKQSLMTPGHSEHHLGLAVDLHGSDAMFDWLGEHCWEYGFILRYPEGKSEQTGIIYEPWHFRYVGTELSLELQGTGLCLEEYMQQLTMSTTEEQGEEPAV